MNRSARRNFLRAFPLSLAFGGGLADEALASNTTAASPGSQSFAPRLLEEFNKTWLFDTHEHIIPESQRLSERTDFFSLAGGYTISDVISAGLPPEDLKLVNDHDAPVERRWSAFAPYWQLARFTGYAQALRIALRDLYGVERLDTAAITRINEAVRAANTPGLYRRILKDRARIRVSVVDDNWTAVPARLDPEYFLLAHKFDRFVTVETPAHVKEIEKLSDISITKLPDLRRALEKMFAAAIETGMIAVKSTLAYNRELLFHEVAEREAELTFERVLRGEIQVPQEFRHAAERPARPLEDYMFHQVIRQAEAHDLPVQIHTGLLAGNGGFITNTRPTLLTNLLFLYPRVKFDLLHMGYPYQDECCTLAKCFPNVYLDLCWVHIISPRMARAALHEFLETIPSNKIFGFGGDYRYPELSYAHAQMARGNVAQVLAEKVEAHELTETEALELGRKLLHDNGAAFFRRPA